MPECILKWFLSAEVNLPSMLGTGDNTQKNRISAASGASRATEVRRPEERE